MDCSALPKQINELSIILTNDQEIQKLNKAYRRKDKATDVLSFSSIEGIEPQQFETQLGELVISLDTAETQAKKYRVPLEEETIRLIVHGILHLLGYDHEKVPASTAQRMRRKERSIRKTLLGVFGSVPKIFS